jgi:hypothetical protein
VAVIEIGKQMLARRVARTPRPSVGLLVHYLGNKQFINKANKQLLMDQ